MGFVHSRLMAHGNFRLTFIFPAFWVLTNPAKFHAELSGLYKSYYKTLFLAAVPMRPWHYLTQTFLSRPHRCVDDLQEELTRPRVEDKDGAIDWFSGQVAFKRLFKKKNTI